jgi:hypothetical protein
MKYVVHGMVPHVGLEQVFAAQQLLDQDILESQVIYPTESDLILILTEKTHAESA